MPTQPIVLNATNATPYLVRTMGALNRGHSNMLSLREKLDRLRNGHDIMRRTPPTEPLETGQKLQPQNLAQDDPRRLFRVFTLARTRLSLSQMVVEVEEGADNVKTVCEATAAFIKDTPALDLTNIAIWYFNIVTAMELRALAMRDVAEAKEALAAMLQDEDLAKELDLTLPIAFERVFTATNPDQFPFNN